MQISEVKHTEIIDGIYEKRVEIWEIPECPPSEVTAAHSLSGDYIGSLEWADTLVKRGIRTFEANPAYSVCSIGFNPDEQKWYGWSHRAIFGFGVGSEVKKGDIAYHAPDADSFLEDMVRFWESSDHLNVRGEHGENQYDDKITKGVWVHWEYSAQIPNFSLRHQNSSVFQEYPDEWGRGEWIAKNLEDAKQMALDFAEGCS